jgi:cyclase
VTSKKLWIPILGLAIALHAPAYADSDERSGGEARSAAESQNEIDVVHIRDGVYLLASASGNTTVQIGPDGVLVVDTMRAGMSEKLVAAIRKLTNEPIHYILNTSAHPDSVGGNAGVAQAGNTIAGGNVLGAINDARAGAAVLAHENVLNAMSSQDPAPPFEGWPTSTYFVEKKDLYFNNEPVQLLHQPHATANGDSIVWFRRADVISAGQIFSMESYPFIDAKSGGSIQGLIDALNRLIDIAVARPREEGGTMIVPAYGRLCDQYELVEYRDMLTLIRDQIREMIREGRTLKQVQEARPTLGFDPRFGSDSGPWTTRMFVESIYRELSKSRSSRK